GSTLGVRPGGRPQQGVPYRARDENKETLIIKETLFLKSLFYIDF
ncbi:MAG: hypothetical protein ACD_3C00121G0002, partial [uncultured bacterium (gcode 4)]